MDKLIYKDGLWNCIGDFCVGKFQPRFDLIFFLDLAGLIISIALILHVKNKLGKALALLPLLVFSLFTISSFFDMVSLPSWARIPFLWQQAN